MALTSQNISMYAGETKDITFSVVDSSDVPLNISGCVLKWGYALNTLEPSRLTKTTSSGITVTNASSGYFSVHLDDIDTSGKMGDYYHEAQLTDALGNVSVISNGTLSIIGNIL